MRRANGPPGKSTVWSGKSGMRSRSIENTLLLWFAPTAHQLVRNGEVIENARHHEIDEVFDTLGFVIETGCGRKDSDADTRQGEHVLQMDRRERGLAWHQ